MQILWRCSLRLATVFTTLTFLVISGTAGSESIAPVKIGDLFAQADQVALVEIRSGDAEHYPIAVYKAVVEVAYKGTIAGQTIYFGPYVSYNVGGKYLLFLSKGKPVSASTAGSSPYGDLDSVGVVMCAGYGALPVTYECVFDGDEIRNRCDYAIQLNPEQVVLPEIVKLFPPGDATAVTNYNKWLRKTDMMSLLLLISHPNSSRGARQ